MRDRKAVTFGFHVLLGALGERETATRAEARFGGDPQSDCQHFRAGLADGVRVLVLCLSVRPTRWMRRAFICRSAH
jgi:hypothetical protein